MINFSDLSDFDTVADANKGACGVAQQTATTNRQENLPAWDGFGGVAKDGALLTRTSECAPCAQIRQAGGDDQRAD